MCSTDTSSSALWSSDLWRFLCLFHATKVLDCGSKYHMIVTCCYDSTKASCLLDKLMTNLWAHVFTIKFTPILNDNCCKYMKVSLYGLLSRMRGRGFSFLVCQRIVNNGFQNKSEHSQWSEAIESNWDMCSHTVLFCRWDCWQKAHLPCNLCLHIRRKTFVLTKKM